MPMNLQLSTFTINPFAFIHIAVSGNVYLFRIHLWYAHYYDMMMMLGRTLAASLKRFGDLYA
jgi:hypothetical protein